MKRNDTTETARDKRGHIETFTPIDDAFSTPISNNGGADADLLDPFNPENLRLDPSYLSQPAAKKLLTVIPVKRPHRQDFVRVHPDKEYRLLTAVLELHEDRETFLVLRNSSHRWARVNTTSQLFFFTSHAKRPSASGRRKCRIPTAVKTPGTPRDSMQRNER